MKTEKKHLSPQLLAGKLGFTLIELLVVSTIIILLTMIGLVSYTKVSQSSRNAKRKADLETVRQALVLYKNDEGCYPIGVYDVITPTLNGAGYLSSPTPQDPKFPTREYTYAAIGAGSCGGTLAIGFTLGATLEPGSISYSLGNP